MSPLTLMPGRQMAKLLLLLGVAEHERQPLLEAGQNIEPAVDAFNHLVGRFSQRGEEPNGLLVGLSILLDVLNTLHGVPGHLLVEGNILQSLEGDRLALADRRPEALRDRCAMTL